MFNKDEIVAALANRMAENAVETPLGAATNVTCRCGGTMHEFDRVGHMAKKTVASCGNPRHSRKKRIHKKFFKAWIKKHGRTLQMASFMMPLRNPETFKCERCGTYESFYRLMGRAMIKVESLTGV